MAPPHFSPVAFYVLFVASGFAGLIYESVWTHYLKLYLGHAAYAQSLALILPQSMLLGATFPLMSAGLVRASMNDGRRAPGEAVAMLYFTNSLGAAAGVLASGFILIAWAGLPGTLRTAGVINLVLAAAVALLARPASALPPIPPRSDVPGGAPPARMLLAIALLTGLA